MKSIRLTDNQISMILTINANCDGFYYDASGTEAGNGVTLTYRRAGESLVFINAVYNNKEYKECKKEEATLCLLISHSEIYMN